MYYRTASLHWGHRQNSPGGGFGGPIQKSPSLYGEHDTGTSISSKVSRFQDLERTRSPIQYTEDFLADPASDGMEGNADIASSLHGSVASHRRQSPSSAAASNHSIMNPSSTWNKSQRPALFSHQWDDPARPGSHSSSLLNGRSISPTKTFDTRQPRESSSEDEIQRSLYVFHDASRRSSISPPKSRSGTGVLGVPDFQYNQRSSPSADGMNGDAYAKKLESHSVSKRNRSPPSVAPAAGQILLTSSVSTEDDTERELQAKAKRLARFKVDMDEVKPSDSMQYGPNVAKKRISSIRSDQSAVEKQKSSWNPSGSMEEMSQDIDNEDLQSCGVIVGLCPDMCPESERAERERKGDLDRYERLDGDRNQTTKSLAVKKYNRTAEREAESIRPMPILQKTMGYLLGLLEQPYDDRFLGLYNFLWDRMRAIRMDLRMQHIFNLEAITMLEQMIRLHIIAMHELCEFSKGEGFSEGFDAHLNIEQMNKTSVELFQLYDDHRKRGIIIPTEKEFRGYYALLKLDKHPGYKVEPAELSLDLAKMTAEMRQTNEVRFARDVARSCRTINFIAFFRHARKASYLQACLIHAHFSKLRTQALASLHSGLQYNQGLPVAYTAKWLCMEGEDIESLLEYHGFTMKEFEEPYMVKEGPFLNAEKDYPTRCSILVHKKKSNTIVEDILSSPQALLVVDESEKKLQSDRDNTSDNNNKNKHAVVQPIQTKSPCIVSDGLMDIDTASSPRNRRQVQSLLETSRINQPYTDSNRRAPVSFPKFNIEMPKAFGSFQSHSTQEQPSPATSKDSSHIVHDGELSFKTPLWNISTPQVVPDNNSSYIERSREACDGGLVRSSLENSSEIVLRSDVKAMEPDIVSAKVNEVMLPAREVDSGIAISLQNDVSMEEVARKEFTDAQQNENIDVRSYYDEEVAKAKLKLLLRLWRRRFARKRELHDKNRLAANAALSSLSLGPPVRHNKDKPTPCIKLNFDQAVSEREEKRHQSWARWNVSELVAAKLGEKNSKSNCICWKVIVFSWLHWGNVDSEERNPVTHMSLDQWLQYKLIPSRKDETGNDLVMSAPGMAIWRKWVHSEYGGITCCLSVIKDAESGNFEKRLVGTSAILYPVSDTVPWELQRVQLHNLVMSLPAGACVPLLILSGSEWSCSIVDKLGLKDIDNSHVGSFSVICVNEKEDTAQFDGYFSDHKLKEGLTWLASETHPQPGLYHVTMRELVSSHLNPSLNAVDLMGSDKLGPNQFISIFNEALDQSMNDIVTAANMNPTAWPCPELFLLDNSTDEFRAVRQFLPSLGWSFSEEIEPLISAVRNLKLPSFSDDISWLSRGCSTGREIEDQGQLLQDCLIRYLTHSSNVMSLMMATKEAVVMLQKCTRLELHNTEYKVVPSWLLIFRRVFNWQLNTLASINSKGYVLEQSHPTSVSPLLEKSEFEASTTPYIVQPSLDEMVEVSCSPIISKSVRSSPRSFRNVSETTSIRITDVDSTSSYLAEEENQCSMMQVELLDSDVYPKNSDVQLAPKAEKEADKLSMLLHQCNILQNEIDKRLSIYF